MKILFVGTEYAPILKHGGLGDVMSSLPLALQGLGHNVDVIIPYFPDVNLASYTSYKSLDLSVSFKDTVHTVSVFTARNTGDALDIFLLRSDLFDTTNYGKTPRLSDVEIHAFFDLAVVAFLESQFNTYDVVHCHDWHTGLIPHLLRDTFGVERPATVFTVHNALYRGRGDSKFLEEVQLSREKHPLLAWDSTDGAVELLLQGIASSDYVSVVSPSYAKELLVSPDIPDDYVSVLKGRSSRIVGILNGIDYSHLPRYYDVHTYKQNKPRRKAHLYSKIVSNSAIPLSEWMQRPVISFVGRLDPYQKGLDLFKALILHYTRISTLSPIFILLGTGDPLWESELLRLSQGCPNFFAQIAFDTPLSYDIYSGSDFLFVPSRYEPCGLVQMISMFYGTPPIAHATGGLKDTIVSGVTGFLFENFDVNSAIGAVDKAISLYRKDAFMHQMIRNCMFKDFGWGSSARAYVRLYDKALSLRKLIRQLAQPPKNPGV